MGLAELLAAAAQADNDRSRPRIFHLCQVARLREFAGLYAQPNAFKIGDVVTPRRGSNIKDAGEPHIVVDVIEPRFHFEGRESSGSSFGRRLTVRVAQISGDSAICFWGEHHDYEPYTGASDEDNSDTAA